MTPYLQILVENSKTIIPGNKGNRYKKIVKQISAFEFIRAGKKHYNFLAKNLKLPEISTTRKFIDKQLRKVYEGEFLFDELVQFLDKHNLGRVVGIFEDGTKVNECVEYSADNNTLLGLVSPIEEGKGSPFFNYFKAENARQIEEAILKHSRSSYVQVLVVKANKPCSPTFILSFHGTDNRFTFKNVSDRNQYIYVELQKRGVKAEVFGSDGDTRFLKAQKLAINFGHFQHFAGFELAGNLSSKYFGHQDGLHIAKKLLNRLYDMGCTLILGENFATLNHLILVFKTYERSHHHLTLSDIDPRDSLNYT